MKKISLSIMVLCCALFASAEPIGKQAALYTAKSFMLAKGKTVNAAQTPHKASGVSTSGQQEQAYYYVYNAGNDGGYVIVSGDDRVEPILGYVEQGSFDPDNIPENMRSWLQLYADQIKFIVENDIQPGDPRIQKRNKVIGTKHSVPELMKSRWNQGHPYNLTCPDYYTNKDNDVHHYPATGCAATAMAQVINFYKYPAKTKAAIPSHSKTYTLKDNSQQTVTVNAVPKGTKIDWENMRDTYSCNDDHVHDAPDTAVANLMLYCGQSLKMGWGASSGADTSKSRDALVNYFGFDARAYWASRPNYSIDEWFDMLYDEMEAGYPVLYRGHSSGGGHAFVIDGFDGDNLFHVNWGWGGGSNGWFLISILNPGDNSGMGASSSSDGYSMTQGGVFNLRTPDTPKDPYLYISDVTISGSSVKAKFTNKTGAKGTFNAGVVMYDENGEIVLVSARSTISGLEDGSSQTKTLNVKNLTEGTYRLSPASKPSRGTVWRPKYDLFNQYIEAVVDSLGGIDLHFPYPSYEAISIDTITFPGTRIAGQQQEVKVTFRNDGKEYFKTVYLLASKTQTKTYTDSKSMVAVRYGETVDVSYFFKPTETGIYNLWLATDDKGNNVIGQGTVEIIPDSLATKANLSVTKYTFSNTAKIDNVEYPVGKRLVGTATIQNNASEDYHGRVKIQLWHQKKGSNTATSGTTRSFNVDVNAGKTANINFEFDNLSESYYYRFKVLYGNQDGTLGNGGLWDNRWEVRAGGLTWKEDGTIGGLAYKTTMRTAVSTVGFYADCDKITRIVSSSDNPNIIYAFAAGMAAPKGLNNSNAVYGSHADGINLVNDMPYYIPVSFDADSASFTYTFAETENGTKWHAFTMPFASDSILLDNQLVSLEDSLNHFWIYEFAAEGDNGEVLFTPATTLRGGTPYIIAADKTMAGRSLVFCAINAHFFKTGTDKMLVTSPSFKFHGNTYSPKLKDIYVLNEEGTAFELTTTNINLDAMASYFTTTLPEETRPLSIVLPDVPVFPISKITLDEMATEPIVAGTYDELTLNRTFEVGFNTICLPFQVDDITGAFSYDVQAYEFYSLRGTEVNFVKVDTLAAGKPYIILVPDNAAADISSTFVLEDITINEESIEAGFVEHSETILHGTYSPVIADEQHMEIFGLAVDGTLESQDQINGFRAYFTLPDNARDMVICLWDDATSIKDIRNSNELNGSNVILYNIAGQRISKMQKGINIINGKKVLR